MIQNSIHNIAFKQKEKAKKKKFELKSEKEKIVMENLKKKNCDRASPPRNTLRKIPRVTTACTNRYLAL